MMRRRVLRLSIAAAMVVAGSSCYSYHPVEDPAPGTTVRVQVPVASNVVRPNRAPETVAFEGTLVSLGDTLLLEVKSRREVGAFREYLELDTLRVAQGNISLIEERLFSKPKTYAFTAVLTVGAAALAITALNALTGSQGDPNGPGDTVTPQGRIILNPIFSGLLRLVGR